ncbi:MAG: hypothetical protein AAFU49_22760 [Pseudomonadota bacterium]
MRRFLLATTLLFSLGGCFSTVMDGAGQALLVGSEVAARAYLTQNTRVRGELTLGAQLMTDAVLAFRQYQAGRRILENATGAPVTVVREDVL